MTATVVTKQSEDCRKPEWVNVVFTRGGERVCVFSGGMHGLPRIGDTIAHVDDGGDYFGKVYSIVWAVTTIGSFKATVRVEVRR